MNRGTLGSKLRESLRLAFEAIRSHKMRSGLVILGVGIGVTTLMGMVTILLGLGNKIREDIRSSDNTVIYLSQYDLLVGGDPSRFAHRPDITPLDLRDALSSIGGLVGIALGFGFDYHWMDSHESVGPALSYLMARRNVHIKGKKTG